MGFSKNTINRNYGIDLLRLLSMFGVVVLHTLRRSELLMSDMSRQFRYAWLLEIIVYSSVNCFGLISGFTNYTEDDKELDFSRLIELWLQVFMYGVIITLSFLLFSNEDVVKEDLMSACFPLLKGEYWYFSAFAGVYLLSPFVNRCIRSMSSKQLAKLVVVIVLFFSFMETLSIRLNNNATTFSTGNGYSFIWLLLMYIMGAAIRKTGAHLRVSKIKAAAGIVLCVSVTFIWQIWIGAGPFFSRLSFGKNWDRLLTQYTSPTIVIMAIMYLCLFARIQVNQATKRIISFLAASSFSIYLLNSQPLIARYTYDEEHLRFLLKYDDFTLIPMVLLVAFLFCIMSVCIDRIRIIVFSLFRLKKASQKIGNRIDELIDKLSSCIVAALH